MTWHARIGSVPPVTLVLDGYRSVGTERVDTKSWNLQNHYVNGTIRSIHIAICESIHVVKAVNATIGVACPPIGTATVKSSHFRRTDDFDDGFRTIESEQLAKTSRPGGSDHRIAKR